MARKVPEAEAALQDASLDAALARASRPALPPGLAARIVAQATAHPQLGPCADVAGAAPSEPAAPTAQVIPFAAVAAPPVVVPPHNRRLIFGGGFAALAASLVAVVVIGQQSPQAPIVPNLPKSAEIAVGSEVHLDAPRTHLPALTPRLATAKPGLPAAAQTAEIAPTVPQVAPEPAQVTFPDTPQLATSGERPLRDVAGPTTDPSPAPRVVPNGGLMGPPAPQQGWAFTGGAPGSGTLPGGQSIPSQTTGTMPPPSAPGGGHP